MYARASCECKTSQSNRGPDVRKTSHNRHNALCFITKTKSCSLGWFNFRKDEKMTTLGYQASCWQLRFVTLIMHWTESQTLAFGRLKIYSYFSERKKFQVSTQVSVFNLCCNILQEIVKWSLSNSCRVTQRWIDVAYFHVEKGAYMSLKKFLSDLELCELNCGSCRNCKKQFQDFPHPLL